jgi:hypothetical protein
MMEDTFVLSHKVMSAIIGHNHENCRNPENCCINEILSLVFSDNNN